MEGRRGEEERMTAAGRSGRAGRASGAGRGGEEVPAPSFSGYKPFRTTLAAVAQVSSAFGSPDQTYLLPSVTMQAVRLLLEDRIDPNV